VIFPPFLCGQVRNQSFANLLRRHFLNVVGLFSPILQLTFLCHLSLHYVLTFPLFLRRVFFTRQNEVGLGKDGGFKLPRLSYPTFHPAVPCSFTFFFLFRGATRLSRIPLFPRDSLVPCNTILTLGFCHCCFAEQQDLTVGRVPGTFLSPFPFPLFRPFPRVSWPPLSGAMFQLPPPIPAFPFLRPLQGFLSLFPPVRRN